MAFAKFGEWQKAASVLSRMATGMEATLGRALRREAEELRGEIVEGLTRQAPGGQAIKPLADATLATRRLQRFRGTLALIHRADLRNAISADVRGLRAFVGIPRKTVRGKQVADIARMNEFGAGPITIRVTPAMRKFLFVLLREAGARGRGHAGRGGAAGVVVVRIPARPFVRPAIEVWKRGIRRRFLASVALDIGMPGGGR